MSDYKERSRIVAEVIQGRRSVRRFSEQEISSDVINELLLAGIAAPSGSNWQNQRFLVLSDADEIAHFGHHRFVWPYRSDQSKMKELHPSGIIGHARAVIVVFAESAENDRRGNGEYYMWEALEQQNCAASIENILLLATAKGLGSCWISASDKMSYTRLLSKRHWRDAIPNRYRIPETWKLQGIIALGYPMQTDELGYPKGEKMHGATEWAKTQRQPVGFYLAPEWTDDLLEPQNRSHGIVSRFLMQSGAYLIRLLLFVIKLIDKCLHTLEMAKIDLEYHKKRRDQ